MAKAQEGEGVMVGGGVRCNSLVGREKKQWKGSEEADDKPNWKQREEKRRKVIGR